MSVSGSSKVKEKERCLWRSTRSFSNLCLRVLRDFCVVLFEPPKLVREVEPNRPPVEVSSESPREERYNCIRWQI